MLPKLYYITQSLPGLSYHEQVARVCQGGVRLVQLRLKNMVRAEIISIAREVKQVTDSFGAMVIINDHPEIALEINAHGVHLGMGDMHPRDARKIVGSKMMIGGTANTFDRILELHEYVDYFGIGPFRFTETKEKLAPILGLEGYAQILQKMREHKIEKPVFAIGGVVESDFGSHLEAGVHGIALSSAISKSKDIVQESHKLITALNSYHHVEINHSR